MKGIEREGISLAGKRIGLLTAFASRSNGGVFEAVVQQAQMIRSYGGEAHIFALDDEHAESDRARFSPSPVHLTPIVGPRQIGFAPGMVSAIERANVDLLHLHGIWMYPSAVGRRWARRTGRPYVVSPHGMLDPWIVGRGKVKKALARWGYERASWRVTRCLHALTSREAEDIARESGRTDSVVIPNAGPPANPAPTVMRGPRFLYLGRIHPKKNIGALVDAWIALEDRLEAAGASLTIAGWGADEDVATLQESLQRAPTSARFVGPLFGADKAKALADARFFVLPSFSEGLPMVVLEAWAAGTPTLMTEECNLPQGFAAGAAIDCGYDAATVSASLERALYMDDREWLAMACAAHELADGPFSAGQVAQKWAAFYSEQIGAGEREVDA